MDGFYTFRLKIIDGDAYRIPVQADDYKTAFKVIKNLLGSNIIDICEYFEVTKGDFDKTQLND